MDYSEKLSYKELVWFSVPSILSILVEPLAGLVDTVLVGQFSAIKLAPLAIGVTLFSSFTWVFNFLIYGSVQFLSQANDKEVIKERTKIAMWLSVIVALFCIFVMFSFKDFLFSLGGSSPQVENELNEYYNARLIGQGFWIMLMTISSVLRGLGHVFISFFLLAITTLLNIIITWFLFEQEPGSLFAIGLGTSIAATSGSILGLIILVPKVGFKNFFQFKNLNKADLFYFGSNSLNIFIRSLFLTACFFLSTRFSASIGIEELAFYQVLLQFWLMPSYLTDGIATTATIMGASFVSLNDVRSLKILTRRLLLSSLCIGLLFTLIYSVFGEKLMSFFVSDPSFIKNLLKYWPIIIGAQVINCLAFCYDGIQFGLGNFSFLRKHIVLGVMFIYLPLAYFGKTKGELSFIILGLLGLNLYRLLTNFYKVKRRIF